MISTNMIIYYLLYIIRRKTPALTINNDMLLAPQIPLKTPAIDMEDALQQVALYQSQLAQSAASQNSNVGTPTSKQV